jgi:hypothetical protein
MYDDIQVSLGRMGKKGFRLLTKQKATIQYAQMLILGNPTKKNCKRDNLLAGLLNFIDHIQDECVKQGVPEKVVFPKLKD